MGSKGKPKFRVGEKVWSKQHGKVVTIRDIVYDAGYRLHGYFFKGLPMYWLEYNLRPLTAREAGPARGKKKVTK